MIIPVVLNGMRTVIDASADTMLLEYLRDKKLFSAKEGCRKGHCGFCTVLLDGRAVPSCKVPVGILRDSSIETLEHFATTDDYWDIVSGFEQAGVTLCGYCNASKIFSVYNLLTDFYRPEREQLLNLADSLVCTCTEKKSFISGVMYAVANRHKRLRGGENNR